MAGVNPAIIVILHDVAIGASGRIIGQIGGALGIQKRVATQSNHDSHGHSKDDARYGLIPHLSHRLGGSLRICASTTAQRLER